MEENDYYNAQIKCEVHSRTTIFGLKVKTNTTHLLLSLAAYPTPIESITVIRSEQKFNELFIGIYRINYCHSQ